MTIKVILILIAGTLFGIAAAGFLYTVIRLRPRPDSELDECYYEFEDRHPALARYNKWRSITLTGIFTAMLLLFLAITL